MVSRHNNNVNVVGQEFRGNLWDGILTGKISHKQADALIMQGPIDGQDRKAMISQVEHHFKPPKDPYAAAERRMDEDAKFADLVEKIGRGELRVTDLKEAQKHTGEIGRANVNRLYSFGQKYEGALASPPIAIQQLDAELEMLRSTGVEIPKKTDPKYKVMKGYILDNLVESQAKKGKLLSEEDTKQAIRRTIQDEVPVYMQGGVRGIFGGKYIENKKAWEVTNPESVDVAGILEKRLGKKPTPEQVQAARAELVKPKPTRTGIKKAVPFGGLD
jgi:hypothetical protein